MAKTITAKTLGQVQYTFSDIKGNQSQTDSDSTQYSSSYTYGSGSFQVNSIIKTTGTINSGESIELDFNAYSFSSFGLDGTADFSSIKSILISNTATDSGIDLNVRATGASAATDFFNGESGNLLIKPYSSFMYNDPYDGVDVSSNTKLQIHNVAVASGSTSGNATYSITIMGVV